MLLLLLKLKLEVLLLLTKQVLIPAPLCVLVLNALSPQLLVGDKRCRCCWCCCRGGRRLAL